MLSVCNLCPTRRESGVIGMTPAHARGRGAESRWRLAENFSTHTETTTERASSPHLNRAYNCAHVKCTCTVQYLQSRNCRARPLAPPSLSPDCGVRLPRSRVTYVQYTVQFLPLISRNFTRARSGRTFDEIFRPPFCAHIAYGRLWRARHQAQPAGQRPSQRSMAESFRRTR